ncbi:uncharacterized protein LOC144350624 [Saccoglossus kowalevskii]
MVRNLSDGKKAVFFNETVTILLLNEVFDVPSGVSSPVISNYTIIEAPGETPQPDPAMSTPYVLLYNMIDDPAEQNNLANKFPERINVLIIGSKINMQRNKRVDSLRLNETAWNKDMTAYNKMLSKGVWKSGWCSPISLTST